LALPVRYTRVVHMSLAMSRPWKHPSSGVYWLRKGVPEDLRKLVGKREEKRSLQTRDPVEAKRRHGDFQSLRTPTVAERTLGYEPSPFVDIEFYRTFVSHF
jgi:hypothetical protein